MKIELSEDERQALWAACLVLYSATDRATSARRTEEAEALDAIAIKLRAIYSGSRKP